MPIGLFCGYYRMKYEVEFNKLYEAVFAESSKWASESIGAIRTVASLTLEDAICRRYQDLLDGHVSSAIKKARCVTRYLRRLRVGCQTERRH
jgi:ATP-binding cassette, subfamily B (MDR/TAP), member 1